MRNFLKYWENRPLDASEEHKRKNEPTE